jgi:branched-chain amino acid transport system substrate-binding protein
MLPAKPEGDHQGTKGRKHEMIKSWLAAVAALMVAAPVVSLAQTGPVKIVSLMELSGAGATAGTNFRNGVDLAVKEINAAGGILGRKIEVETFDTETNPGVAKALAQKAIDLGAYVVMGPVFSGSINVSMTETRRAEIPNFMGGEAANLTAQGNPYIFRTSFTQDTAMPKLARYIKDEVHAKSVAMIWVNNDFGKGGRDTMKKALDVQGIAVAADISTDPQQIDFTSAVLKAKQSNADAAFVYLNEEESARALRELRKQGYDKPIIGETTLTGQKVIELAGDAANGVVGHVGLTADAPDPPIHAFDEKFTKAYGYRSDHNGMKGYTAPYIVKAVTEKIGKFDSKEFAKAMHGVSLAVKDHPGILMDVAYDDKGDLDRESFMVKVAGGKQQVFATLPPLARKAN